MQRSESNSGPAERHGRPILNPVIISMAIVIAVFIVLDMVDVYFHGPHQLEFKKLPTLEDLAP